MMTLISSAMVMRCENGQKFVNELCLVYTERKSSDESWDMKFYDCTLKGLAWVQALETP